MHEHIARTMYYFSVHLLFASIVGVAAWLLTAIRGASATTKYWIWVVTAFNFVVPSGAFIDKIWAPHLTWARPLGAIGGAFRLEDQSGAPVTEQDIKGRPNLVFFGYTHCPDVCPATLFEISEVMKALGRDADRAGALFITVDPERDTPAVLKDYLLNFDPHLRGLTGDPAAVAAALKAYRVYAKKVPLDGGDSADAMRIGRIRCG